MKAILTLFISLSLVFASENKPVKILSIDGGGVRGIVPAMILEAIEKKMSKRNHIAESFDVFAGTSTGGLIVMMLNVPDSENNPRYSVSDIVKFYKVLSPKIFDRSYFRYFFTLGGLTGAKYHSEGLEKLLKQYFLDYKLSDLRSNVVIPSFNITKNHMHFFRTSQAATFENKDYYLRDVGRATSAAPTYFDPVEIRSMGRDSMDIFIDGGVGINNPTISSVVYAIELFGINRPFFVLSIGCGSYDEVYHRSVRYDKFHNNAMGVFDWSTEIIDILMNSVNDVAHYQAMMGLKPKYYYRLQVPMDGALLSMDNADPANIEKLISAAKQFIADNDRLLTKIASILDETHQYYYKPKKRP